jgi:C-terminal processing protease CtpA/Prc
LFKGYRVLPDTFIQETLLNGQRIGYIRVSSFDQNPERQLEQVQVNKVFTDKASSLLPSNSGSQDLPK